MNFRVKRWQQEIIPLNRVDDNDNDVEQEILTGILSTSFISKKYKEKFNDLFVMDLLIDVMKWPKI